MYIFLLPGKTASNDEVTPDSDRPEDQKLQKEINWCIDQFRLGLMTQKSTQKQSKKRVVCR